MSNVAVNMDMQLSLQGVAFTSFGYVFRSGIAGAYGSFSFNA
jgi:hypothetical protein